MRDIRQIEELEALFGPASLIRIPDEIDVPVTPRIRRLIDTPAFRRLSRISQLGLVANVYPAANHTRFEHSLGVYRLALMVLSQLSSQAEFRSKVSPRHSLTFVIAALLHDIGHWPYCHPIEDLNLPETESHEWAARRFITEGEIADILTAQFDVQPDDVMRLLSSQPRDSGEQVLCSLLSGPIDIDKMDYLYRDSLHAGVPYGKNFDSQRLIRSLCLSNSGSELAITDKGRTAAEMMVFSRYIMFSEVYWHHAVRSATAMYQRLYFELYRQGRLPDVRQLTEAEWVERLLVVATDATSASLADGLFGSRRRLYKRWLEWNAISDHEIYPKLARRPFEFLVRCGDELAARLAARINTEISPGMVLIDAPPTQLEIQFDLDVYDSRSRQFHRLGQLSPVVQTLANHQFDDIVKRVRIFVAPEIASAARGIDRPEELIQQSIIACECPAGE